MKKALLIAGCVVGVLVGALLLWKIVIPFVGFVIQWIFDTMGSVFGIFA